MSKEIDPDRSETGNTQISVSDIKNKIKQPPMRKNHFFTYNNYDLKEIDPIVATLKKFAYKGKIQTEIGENGTPHLQGMIWCKDKCRDTEFKLSKKIHWEALKDFENKSDYCAKDETHDGVFRTSWGFPKPINIIKNLYPWQQEIENIILSEPDDRKIYWFWESIGNVGKSAFVKYCVMKHGVIFCQGGKESDLMNLIFNSDMDKSNCVIFDLPRAHKGNISYSSLENIKNGLVCNTKYETGFKAFNSPHVIIFANYPPSDADKMSSDRWIIKCLNEFEKDIEF